MLKMSFIFADEKTAMEDFYNHGGVFTEEELNEINFNNLINKN